MRTETNTRRIRDLAGLRHLLSQDEGGFERYVVPHLRIGDVWWIPDDVTGFGNKEQHPWVIVRGYHTGNSTILACPRTSTSLDPHRGIITPANLITGLDREGLFILAHRRSFVAHQFQSLNYIGRLAEEWIGKIKDFYKDK